jgi:hypothetical protein
MRPAPESAQKTPDEENKCDALSEQGGKRDPASSRDINQNPPEKRYASLPMMGMATCRRAIRKLPIPPRSRNIFPAVLLDPLALKLLL